MVMLLLCTLAIVLVACGGDGAAAPPAKVTFVPYASPSVAAPIGGKPATPPTATATAVPATATAVPVEQAAEDPVATVEQAGVATATAAPEPTATALSSGPPAEGRWIEIDVTRFVVRLMDGASVVREVGPVGVGVQIDTGEYASTQTGLFHVYNKIEGLAYDPPYDTYISHWVGFDPDKANGFHSFLKDAEGNVVDPATGRVSNGCIRTGDAEAIFAYAEIGMPVWVHW